MKSRMFVVDNESIISTTNSLIAGVRIPINEDGRVGGKQWVKTIADIMADMLQIHIGDYIFLWETKNGTQKSRIHGVYRATSEPYFAFDDNEDIAPFKIHIEKAYDFNLPIDEYDVLNCPYIKSGLWTIIGKKVAGKKRGTSPLSLEDSKSLIMLLIGKNPNYTFMPEDKSRTIDVDGKLEIDYTKQGKNQKAINKSDLKIENINFFSADKHKPYYEKILETIFNQELRKENNSFFNQLGINPSKVIWYSNYLPYSIETSEMDYVLIESEDGLAYSKIFVIDFIKDKIDIDHIHRTLMYAKWINDTIGLGTNITQPMIVCGKSVDFSTNTTNIQNPLEVAAIEDEQQYNCKKLSVYEYDFSHEQPKFIKKR